MATKPKLNSNERDILERYGVIDAPPVPTVEKLGEAVTTWGGQYTLQVTTLGVAQAIVVVDNQSFPGVADTPSQALCTALCNALVAIKRTANGQATLFDDVPASRDDVPEATFVELPHKVPEHTDETPLPGDEFYDDDPDATQTDMPVGYEASDAPTQFGDLDLDALNDATKLNEGMTVAEPNGVDDATPTKEQIALTLTAAGIQLRVVDDEFVDGASGRRYVKEQAEWIYREYGALTGTPGKRARRGRPRVTNGAAHAR